MQFLLRSFFHTLSCNFSSSCQVLSFRPAKYLMNSSLSICHKTVHESSTQLHTMLITLPLHCFEGLFKSVAIDHYIFLLLKINQICPLVCSIFKSNSTSLQQVRILESVMTVSMLEYVLGILYTVMNICLKSVPMIFLITTS
jgi:hypothetical protein